MQFSLFIKLRHSQWSEDEFPLIIFACLKSEIHQNKWCHRWYLQSILNSIDPTCVWRQEMHTTFEDNPSHRAQRPAHSSPCKHHSNIWSFLIICNLILFIRTKVKKQTKKNTVAFCRSGPLHVLTNLPRGVNMKTSYSLIGQFWWCHPTWSVLHGDSEFLDWEQVWQHWMLHLMCHKEMIFISVMMSIIMGVITAFHSVLLKERPKYTDWDTSTTLFFWLIRENPSTNVLTCIRVTMVTRQSYIYWYTDHFLHTP